MISPFSTETHLASATSTRPSEWTSSPESMRDWPKSRWSRANWKRWSSVMPAKTRRLRGLLWMRMTYFMGGLRGLGEDFLIGYVEAVGSASTYLMSAPAG